MNFLRQAEIFGKKVLVRADFNVSLDEEGKVIDDFRLRATIPTIRHLLGKNCRIILAAHFGRPRNGENEEFSLKPVAEKLAELLKKEVKLAKDCVGPETKKETDFLKEGEILLLENLRFYPEEETNDENFAKNLASLAEIYINDAFGVSHRAHASVEAITKFLPSYAGLLLEKEILNLERAKNNPEHPLVVIFGGSKISTKLKVIANFLEKADKILLGGALANTLLYAKGLTVGRSLIEKDILPELEKILASPRIHLPIDAVVCINPEGRGGYQIGPIGQTSDNEMILDIGPKTEKDFADVVAGARMVVWNGPMGLFEKEAFSHGTKALGEAISQSQAFSVVGGGETVAFLEKLGLINKFNFVSTGGGAMMEFLAGEKLPGLLALER